MIELKRYKLTATEKKDLENYLNQVGANPSLEQIWNLMDQAWHRAGCRQSNYEARNYNRFYADPVWLLNGIYIEQDPVSMGHRHSIANAVASLGPKRILDFGGGFGTLARLMADRLPASQIFIYDPFPPAHGVEICKPYPNITYIDTLTAHQYDALVCTDVLEHLHDPLCLLAELVETVKPRGHLFIANCFEPVILCHLPCTFHLRYFFSWCVKPLGLHKIGHCQGSHAWIYQRSSEEAPNLSRARLHETLAKALHPLLSWLVLTARHMVRALRKLPIFGAAR
ncbi:Methyltransferase domain family [Cyanobium sp. NIES-981]|nr:Methyltransferase domain family [Cyanobium sp. NIES-981]